ncbi:MAG: hypothetical protein EBU32_13730, partial [Opitutaceae bacterium]|nr:hypothetical protein [Opitutaceae bacterium]
MAALLATTIADALPLFAEHPKIHQRLAALAEVGLGYLPLGQPLNTLSGGEAQRLKLIRYLAGFTDESAAHLVKEKSRPKKNPAGPAGPAKIENQPASPSAGALLLLDEPTTGLHRHDVKRLLAVLQRIVDRGHSIIVIEHNLDVLKSADWILEIGPEAGAQGGQIVLAGTPEDLAHAITATSPFLRAALSNREFNQADAARRGAEPAAHYETTPRRAAPELTVIGARENNLKNISLTIPHRQLTVVTGVSGSGKSTLAFDIIFAEGQRRFMESMSPYARQFVEQLPRPDIDRLTGIPPTVAIEQRSTRGSRKSTVATITEVAQYLRLLYARLGVQHHPETGRAVTPLTPTQLQRLLEKVIAPLTSVIEQRLRKSEITLAEERFFATISKSFLYSISRGLKLGTFAPRIVVATPLGQMNDTDACIVATAAAMRGWKACLLGANQPASELVAAVATSGACALALSIVYPENDPTLIPELMELGKALPRQIKVFVGGSAADS